MKQIVFTCAARNPLSSSEILAEIASARAHRSALGVSSIVLHCGGVLLQVLEGAEPYVDRTFGELLADPRFAALRVIAMKPIELREFSSFALHFAEIPADEGAREGLLHASPRAARRLLHSHRAFQGDASVAARKSFLHSVALGA